jgi:hypothetical protein
MRAMREMRTLEEHASEMEELRRFIAERPAETKLAVDALRQRHQIGSVLGRIIHRPDWQCSIGVMAMVRAEIEQGAEATP